MVQVKHIPVVKDREQFLIELKKHLPEKCTGAEIGVLNGDFSRMILDVFDPALLILVDPFERCCNCYGEGVGYLPTAYSTGEQYEQVSKRFEKEINLNMVYILRHYSFNAVNMIAHDIDFVYHDASHLYEDLKRDLSEWLPLMKKRGLVCGHDYGNDVFPGVKQAVDEFINEHNFEMIIFNTNGGDYALRAIQ